MPFNIFKRRFWESQILTLGLLYSSNAEKPLQLKGSGNICFAERLCAICAAILLHFPILKLTSEDLRSNVFSYLSKSQYSHLCDQDLTAMQHSKMAVTNVKNYWQCF